MSVAMKVFAGTSFLGGRARAYHVRTQAVEVLAADSATMVILDFTSVEGVSHSFADELLSPLTDLLGEEVPHRVMLRNCSASVQGDLQSVAEMHNLQMPAPESAQPIREYA